MSEQLANKIQHHFSLDQLYEDGEYEPLATNDIEEEAMLNITIKSMYNELKDEDERCIDVFSLLINENTQREIASELGISQTAVSWYIKRIRKRNLKSSDKHNCTAGSIAPWWCLLYHLNLDNSLTLYK